LDANFSQKFVNKDFKTHREKVLFDREKSMLPATQVYVERRKRKTEIEHEMNELNKQIARLKVWVNVYKSRWV
jgi:hypothetical protein